MTAAVPKAAGRNGGPHRARHGAEARQILLSICVYLSVGDAGRKNLPLWQEALREILPHCGPGPLDIAGLINAAEAFAAARGARAQDHALARVRRLAHDYLGARAADRVEAWRRAGVAR
jgi:hypothetical protein